MKENWSFWLSKRKQSPIFAMQNESNLIILAKQRALTTQSKQTLCVE
jgi:hypothetical protein